MFRRLSYLMMAGSLAVLVIESLSPISSLVFKAAFLAGLGGLWLGFLLLLWPRPGWRKAMLILPVLALLPLVLPGRVLPLTDLRVDYVRRLESFKNTPYAWGGESARGIDCSGLPRRAFREALLLCGLRTLNGTAIREGVSQWWFDASALALGKGHRGATVPLGIQGPIRSLDLSRLQPGDLAVTMSGVHMLAYLGDEVWIQADPSAEAVIALNGRIAANAWFDQPVTLHRWALLAP